MVNEDATIYTEQRKKTVNEDFELPQWQKDVIDKRLKDIEKGKTNFQDFDSAIREIEKEL